MKNINFMNQMSLFKIIYLFCQLTCLRVSAYISEVYQIWLCITSYLNYMLHMNHVFILKKTSFLYLCLAFRTIYLAFTNGFSYDYKIIIFRGITADEY